MKEILATQDPDKTVQQFSDEKSKVNFAPTSYSRVREKYAKNSEYIVTISFYLITYPIITFLNFHY